MVTSRSNVKKRTDDPAAKKKFPKHQEQSSKSTLLKIVLFDLSAIPILIGVQWCSSFLNPISLTLVGGGLLASVVYLAYKTLPVSNDPFYYFYIMCSFTCIIDLMLALETVGLLDGVCDLWLKIAEEYLDTKWGAAINLIDGTVHYALYLSMIKRILDEESYLYLDLFWCGSILNSMAVLLSTAFFGPFPLHFGILLNLPYAIVPLCNLLLINYAALNGTLPETINESPRMAKMMNLGAMLLCGLIGIVVIPLITNHYQCTNIFVKMQYYVSMGFTITTINFQTDFSFGPKLLYFAGGLTFHALASQFLQCAVL